MDNISAILLFEIKKKRKLSGIADRIIEKEIEDYFRKNPSVVQILEGYALEKQLKRSSEFKKIVKKIREKYWASYSIFQIPKNADEIKRRFLKKVREKALSYKDIEEALSMHLSTKERLPFYDSIYEQIFEITGKPHTILDVSCGINPLSLPFMRLKKFNYIATDIDKSSLEFVQAYFDLAGISGKTVLLDVSDAADRERLKGLKADVCFLFKALELDKRIAEEIVESISAKFIVASFSTVSVSGEIMSQAERMWFEKMLHRLNKRFETFRTGNEIFYIIRK